MADVLGMYFREWPHLAQRVAVGLTRLLHLGHFAPVVKARAHPIGPSTTPSANQRNPFAPRLVATIAVQIPKKSPTRRISTANYLSQMEIDKSENPIPLTPRVLRLPLPWAAREPLPQRANQAG